MESNPKAQSAVTEPAVAKSLLGDVLNEVYSIAEKLRLISAVEDVKDGLAHLETLSGWLKETISPSTPKKSKKATTSK